MTCHPIHCKQLCGMDRHVIQPQRPHHYHHHYNHNHNHHYHNHYHHQQPTTNNQQPTTQFLREGGRGNWTLLLVPGSLVQCLRLRSTANWILLALFTLVFWTFFQGVEILILHELWAGERLVFEKGCSLVSEAWAPNFSVGCSVWSRY